MAGLLDLLGWEHDGLDRRGRITCPTLVADSCCDGIAPGANAEGIVVRVPQASRHR
jgi:hypothetical protein